MSVSLIVSDPVFGPSEFGRASFRTRQCIHCGASTIVLLDVAKVDRWRAGEYVQSVWPEMSASARELLMTGTHPACWDAMFGSSSGWVRMCGNCHNALTIEPDAAIDQVCDAEGLVLCSCGAPFLGSVFTVEWTP